MEAGQESRQLISPHLQARALVERVHEKDQAAAGRIRRSIKWAQLVIAAYRQAQPPDHLHPCFLLSNPLAEQQKRRLALLQPMECRVAEQVRLAGACPSRN